MLVGVRATGHRPAPQPGQGSLQQVSAAGARLALAPFRLLELLTDPLRQDLRLGVRRSLGVPERPLEPASDPETAFLDPHGVARRVHADLPAMLVGGLAALLLQTLHPLAMAGVAEHSNYRDDPLGRLRRTAAFVGATTFGTKAQAQEAIDQVKRVHRRVRGVAPDGRPYSANDPELLTWVHAAEMWSFLQAVQRYGPARFDTEECDAYYAETSAVAYTLGAQWVPQSVDEMDAYFRRVRGELYAGSQALAARDFLLRGMGRRPEDRAVHAVLVGAAVGVLPDWARAELRIPSLPAFDALLVRPLARSLCSGLRWAVRTPGTGAVPPR